MKRKRNLFKLVTLSTILFLSGIGPFENQMHTGCTLKA